MTNASLFMNEMNENSVLQTGQVILLVRGTGLFSGMVYDCPEPSMLIPLFYHRTFLTFPVACCFWSGCRQEKKDGKGFMHSVLNFASKICNYANTVPLIVKTVEKNVFNPTAKSKNVKVLTFGDCTCGQTHHKMQQDVQ